MSISDTKFKYGDIVLIKEGFYRGKVGVVVECIGSKGFFYLRKVRYRMVFLSSQRDINISVRMSRGLSPYDSQIELYTGEKFWIGELFKNAN